MCAIDWSLIGMKQFLYAIHQHSEKRIDIQVTFGFKYSFSCTFFQTLLWISLDLPRLLHIMYFISRYTLSCKEDAIAVMLCAFFPKFPTHSNDNRYHLQAFRHLYVLAAERRTVLPRDVDTGFPCYVPIEIRFKVCIVHSFSLHEQP